MKLHLDVQISEALQNTDYALPSEDTIRQWVQCSITAHQKKTRQQKNEFELSLRMVENDEARQINKQFRNKDQATNVLSFPADISELPGHPLLGDILICAPLVLQEARQQGKTAQAHWAHLIVHGSLHLLGYDHIQEQDAKKMESLEISVLEQLHFANPYIEQSTQQHKPV